MGLSISVVGVWLAKIPRLVWPIVITAIVGVLLSFVPQIGHH